MTGQPPPERVDACADGQVPGALRLRRFVRVEFGPDHRPVEGLLVEVAQWPAPSVTVEDAQSGRPTVAFLGRGTRITQLADNAPPPHPAL